MLTAEAAATNTTGATLPRPYRNSPSPVAGTLDGAAKDKTLERFCNEYDFTKHQR